MIQDAAATRLMPAWSAAMTAARSEIPEPVPARFPPGPPPTGVEASVRMALLYAAMSALSSGTARADTSFDPRPPEISPERVRAVAEEMAPAQADKIWKAAHQHAATSPRTSDANFVRRAAWTDGADVASKIQLSMAGDLKLPYKIWISRGDDKVRDLHRKLHGHAVPVGKPFRKWPTGQVLDFPGDTRAPMDAWINCRCFMFLAPTPEGVSEAFAPADLDRAFSLAASLEANLR